MSVTDIPDAVGHTTFEGQDGLIELVLYNDGDLTVTHDSRGGCVSLHDDSVGDLLKGLDIGAETRNDIWDWLREVLS